MTATLPNRTPIAGRRATAGTIVRAKAPLRISFAGGGTDLPHFYEEHGGAVLSATINRHAYVTIYPREDREIVIRSLDMGSIVNYHLDEEPVYDGVLDLVKAALRRFNVETGMHLDIRTEAPAGSGLGGSSALAAAVIGALDALTAQGLTCYELSELNYLVERSDLRIAGGKQDQYATTFGGFNLIELYADRVVVNPLRIDRGVLNDLEAHLLLCYTGRVRTDLGLIDRQVRFYQEGRLETLEGMHRLKQMAYEMKEALLTGRLDGFGEMLHETYVNKKLMNPHITDGTPIDLLYDTAREHGAIGGRLCGAGGGGYLLLYCRTDRQHEVRRSLEAIGGQFTDLAFDDLGLQMWRSASR
jgi:D-glycero-alpha-D-manno-heptose-7-phosphate kinase